MAEFENIDISLALERPLPTIRFFVLQEYVDEIKKEILSLSKEANIEKFVSTKIWPVKIERNPEEWFGFALTIDLAYIIQVFGVVSGLINIGKFLYKAFEFLRRRRTRNEVKKLKMNCTASVALAINHLRSIGAQVKQNQTKLIYLSELLAYYCVAIFASPIINPSELHVITTDIDGNVSSYNLVAL